MFTAGLAGGPRVLKNSSSSSCSSCGGIFRRVGSDSMSKKESFDLFRTGFAAGGDGGRRTGRGGIKLAIVEDFGWICGADCRSVSDLPRVSCVESSNEDSWPIFENERVRTRENGASLTLLLRQRFLKSMKRENQEMNERTIVYRCRFLRFLVFAVEIGIILLFLPGFRR